MSAADSRGKAGAEPASGRKGGSPLLGLLVIAITLALTAFSYHSYATNASQGRGRALLHAAEAVGPACVPLHVAVTFKAGGILEVKASLRDLAGKEVALQERAFPGSQLSIDFLLVPAGKAGKDSARLVLAFPRSVYSDVLPQDEGIRLLPSYAPGPTPPYSTAVLPRPRSPLRNGRPWPTPCLPSRGPTRTRLVPPRGPWESSSARSPFPPSPVPSNTIWKRRPTAR